LLDIRYGDTLKKFADNPVLQKALGGKSGAKVTLSWDEVRALDVLERRIMVEASHDAVVSLNLSRGKAVIDAWDDFAKEQAPGWSVAGFKQFGQRLVDTFDPERQWGEVGKPIALGVKRAMAISSRGIDELRAVMATVEKPEGALSTLTDYFDRQVVTPLRNGQTVTNQGTLNLTTRAFNAIINDPRVWAEGGSSTVIDGLARAWVGTVEVSRAQDAALRKGMKGFFRDASKNGDTLTFDQISEAAKSLANVHTARLETSEPRALGIIAGLLVHSAAQGEMAAHISRALGPGFSPEMGAAMVARYAEGAKASGGAAILLQAYARMGVPITSGKTLRVGWRNVHRAEREIVQFAGGQGDVIGYLPKHLIDKFDHSVGNLVKDLAKYHEGTRTGEGFILRPVLDLFSAWRSSVTTGIGIANPRHWANAMFGDAAQAHVEVGLGMAARRSFQNAFYNIPFLRRHLDSWAVRLGELSKGRPVLGSLTNAVMNPHIAKIWEGSTDKVLTKTGGVTSYDEIMRWGIEDDILETFHHHDMLETLGRSQGPWATILKQAGALQEVTAGHMIAVQQRQRMGLYAELIVNKGATRDEASRVVKNAFYDWKHGVTEWELASIAKVSAFYRYHRLAMKQVFRHLAAPMVAPQGQGFAAYYRQNIPINRLRQQALLVEGLPELLDFTDEDELLSDQKQLDYLAKTLFPEWHRNHPRPMLGGLPADPVRRKWDLEHGRDHPYTARVLPDTGTLTALEMILGFGSMAIGAANLATNLVVDTGGVPEGYWARSMTSLTDLAIPVVKLPRALLGEDKHSRQKRLRAGEAGSAAILAKVPGAGRWFEVGTDAQGRAVMDPGAAELLRVFPVIGTTLPAYFSAFSENPYEDTSQYFGHAMSELFGAGKAVGYNPYEQRDWIVRDIQKGIDRSEKKLEGVYRRKVSYQRQKRK
jgi:hypothetical protein